MLTSIAENFYNLDAYWIIEISWILHIAYVVLRNQEKFVFYVNNYIDWNQFIQLDGLNWVAKGKRNAETVACKIWLVSARATNHSLGVAGE